MPSSMHAVRIVVGSLAIVAPPLLLLPVVLASGLAACNLGIDVDALSAGCAGDCDAAADARAPRADAAGDDAAPTRDASIGGDASPDAAAPCPDAGGTPMVRVDVGGASVCVDRVETTNEAYAAFLDAAAPAAAAPPGCDPGASNAPAKWPPPAGRARAPVTNVTWCAAHAFCAWAGKRLCGAIGGGALDRSLFDRASFDEWFAICSSGGSTAYPYGNGYVAKRCNGDDYGAGAPIPVGSLAGCGAGEGAPLDLSGNVWEWIDGCDPQGNCYARGGAFNSPPQELACASAVASLPTIGSDTIGFRCCAR